MFKKLKQKVIHLKEKEKGKAILYWTSLSLSLSLSNIYDRHNVGNFNFNENSLKALCAGTNFAFFCLFPFIPLIVKNTSKEK
jgi:hypothetical protein